MQWTTEREAWLLTLLERYPVVGVHRHVNIISLAAAMQLLLTARRSPTMAAASPTLPAAPATANTASAIASPIIPMASSSGASAAGILSVLAAFSLQSERSNAMTLTALLSGTAASDTECARTAVAREYSHSLLPTIDDVKIKIHELFDFSSLVCSCYPRHLLLLPVTDHSYLCCIQGV
jgi:hypothetical protein